MSSKAIVEAWNHSQAAGSELLLLLAIADNADPEDGMAWPKESLLASKARVTERQVRRLLEALEKRGELEIWTYVRTGEAALRNAYRVTVGEFSILRGKDPTSLFTRGSGTKAKRRIPPALRRTIMERDGFRCVYCGSTERPSIDHRLPESRGGDDSEENLQVLCVPCNTAKRTMTDDEWRDTHPPIPDASVLNGHTVAVPFIPDASVLSHASDPMGGKQEHSKRTLKRSRARDPIWDTLVEIIGASPAGMERGRWNKAVKSLKESGATPETIRQAAAEYRRLPTFEHCILTPLALANNWTTLTANGRTYADIRNVTLLDDLAALDANRNGAAT